MCKVRAEVRCDLPVCLNARRYSRCDSCSIGYLFGGYSFILRKTSPSYGVGFLGTNSFINKYLRQFSSSSGYSLRASRFRSSSVYYPIRVIGLCWRRVGCGGAPRFVSPLMLRLVKVLVRRSKASSKIPV